MQVFNKSVRFQKLTKKEKEAYNVEGRRFERVDSFGIPLSEHAAAEERAREVREDMRNGIRNLVEFHRDAGGMLVLQEVMYL